MGTSGNEASKAPPLFFGPYAIRDVLGRGGMGVVYRAERLETGERVALKTVYAGSGVQLASIRREIHALSRARHPGIARIVDQGLDQGTPWYAMELYEGESLRGHIARAFGGPPGQRSGARSGYASGLDATARRSAALVTSTVAASAPGGDTLSGRDAVGRAGGTTVARPAASIEDLRPLLSLVAELSGALAFLHGEGLVHRDLKPENVIVRTDGRPVIVDLGIAGSFGGAMSREELAAEGPIIGSVPYMAPEQIRGELADARTDLYALGCVLFECLTGRTPFIGESAQNILYQHLSEPPLPPSRYVDGLDPALDTLALRLLEKRPEDRLGHAEDVALTLSSLGVSSPDFAGAPRPRAYLYRPGLEGRTEVLGELEAAVARAAEGRRGGVIFLGGESGVGKTRLCVEIARRAAHRGAAVITGQCVAVGVSGEASIAASPLHAFRPLFVAIADRCRAEGDGEAARALGAGGEALAAYEPALASLPWIAAQPASPALPPEAARRRVIEAARGAIVAFARRTPTLLVLDDLQWADELSIALLAELVARGLSGEAILVLGTYRMEELGPELAAVVRATGARDVALRRLDGTSVGAMVSGMLALRDPPRDLVDFLAAESDGNPFFVAEYLRAAIGEGLLGRDRLGRWHLYEDAGGRDVLAASVPLPRTLAELLDRRLAALDEDGQRLVQWASVLGREIDGALFAETAALSESSLLEALVVLRLRQIIDEPAPGRLCFVHDKIRETAYARIPEARRRELHARAARAIEARAGGAPEVFPDLGHHYARAGIHDRAAHYLGRAAARARDAYTHEEAIRLYGAAIAEREAAGDGTAEAGTGAESPVDLPSLDSLLEDLGDVLSLLGRRGAARAAFDRALASTGEGRPLPRGRLHRKLGAAFCLDRLHTESLQALDAAESALGFRPDDPGDAEIAREWLEIQTERISVHYWSAQIDAVASLIARARPVAELHGAAPQRARIYRALVQMNVRRERYSPSEETLHFARASREASEEAGVPTEACEATFTLGLVLTLQGSFGLAEQWLSSALEAATRIGHTDAASRCVVYLSLVARRLGNTRAAQSLALRYLGMAPPTGADVYIGLARANLCWVALEAGDPAGATVEGETAIGLWRRSAARYPLEWTARLPLARIARSRGDRSAALVIARAVLDEGQQRLPEAITAPLSLALDAPSDAVPQGVEAALDQALDLARDLHYA